MTLYETLILLIIACVGVGVIVGLSVWAVATMRANLRHERERRELLEKQIQDILDSESMGYKAKALEAANEFLNAVKDGRFRPPPGDW